jgi:hypothetical protein
MILSNKTVKGKFKVQKKLSYLYQEINKFLPESQKLLPTSIKPEQAISSLFESGFFKKISKYFFHEVKKYTEPIENPECIFGIIMGLSLQNKHLIKNSLISLLGNDIKSTYIDGVFSIIINDPQQEKEIRGVLKKLKLDWQLALGLIELTSDDSSRDPYNASLGICKNYCNAARRVSGLVALFKHDLSNVRIICKKLNVDYELMSAWLAWAVNRLDLLKENFKLLSK